MINIVDKILLLLFLTYLFHNTSLDTGHRVGLITINTSAKEGYFTQW